MNTRNKYKNKKVFLDGKTFDSQKEAKRYVYLRELQKQGTISELREQVKFTLIPMQREESAEVYVKGSKKGELKQGKVLERETSYIADFTYMQDGKMVVEDTKGFKTKEYILKRKMMLYFYGIRIKEI